VDRWPPSSRPTRESSLRAPSTPRRARASRRPGRPSGMRGPTLRRLPTQPANTDPTPVRTWRNLLSGRVASEMTLAHLGRLRAATGDRVVVPIQHHDSTAATARAESANHCESQRRGTPHAPVALANMMESADWAGAGIVPQLPAIILRLRLRDQSCPVRSSYADSPRSHRSALRLRRRAVHVLLSVTARLPWTFREIHFDVFAGLFP
jgi:hypothetical protein